MEDAGAAAAAAVAVAAETGPREPSVSIDGRAPWRLGENQWAEERIGWVSQMEQAEEGEWKGGRGDDDVGTALRIVDPKDLDAFSRLG